MSNLKSRIIKNSTIDNTSTLTDSKIFSKKDTIPTEVPMINVALSGRVDSGLTPGLTVIAGHSRHFKSGYALLMINAFHTKYPDGIVLFYDSEFGTPQSYFESFNINMDSVIHTPVTDLEEFKFDIVKQLKALNRDDKVLIILDSLGNLASNKEVTDAEEGKSVSDMTRAKVIKSVFRIITPHLTIKDIPMVVIGHVYEEQKMYGKTIVSGGSGPMLSADTVWVIGRQQDKDNKEKELQGWHFVINIEKSRFVKEKSKIPITIQFEGGINRWSGLFEVAVDGGFIEKTGKGQYHTINVETGEISEKSYKESDLVFDKDFWQSMLKNKKFTDHISDKFTLSHGTMLAE